MVYPALSFWEWIEILTLSRCMETRDLRLSLPKRTNEFATLNWPLSRV